MDDLIDRQQAIDGFDKLNMIDTYETDGDVYLKVRAQDVADMLEQLPSAQPERITITEEERRMYKKLRTFHNGSYAKLLDKLFVSAQPEQQWIPCSETEDLPKHEVLCCDKYGEELIGWLSCEDDQWLCESDGEMMYDPIAWREKPEPWRGEDHEL